MKRYLFISMRICGALLLCLFYAGCSSEPTMETEAATTAVNSMNSLDAINYAADATKEATTAWEQAQKYLAGKQYAEARPYLLKAKGKADLAARMAKSARDTMSKETDSWRTTIDWRYKSLKSGFAERMAKFKPDQKKEMEAIFAKVDQAIEELKKEIDAQHYYKTTNMGKKTMGVVYEGEQMLRGIAGEYTPKSPDAK